MVAAVHPGPALPEPVRSIQEAFAGKVGVASEFRGAWAIEVDKDALPGVVGHCRDRLGFDYLVDLCAVDRFGEEPRFEVVYELSKFGEKPPHLRLRVRVSEEAEEVPTLSGLYGGADWMEREVYDMHGIKFAGHPDLRRILMWEGYPYFPLRKDFPLEGKETDLPGQAFSEVAPLEGGPFVTSPADHMHDREPRARPPELP
jgi:NADH-quinone oxidoreductase subunit C